LAVQSPSGQYSSFLRDKLFLSIYKSCEHRKDATTDARALTDTIIGKLLKTTENGKLSSREIIHTTSEALKHFDYAAMTHYRAFHPKNG
jgi:transcriptional regulator NrdR family protein